MFCFLTSSSTARLFRKRAQRLTSDNYKCCHTQDRVDHDLCLSRSHYTDTDPTSRERERPQRESNPVSQDISEPDESEPFRFILALVAGFFGTIPINPDPSGRIFRNHQDISEPAIRSSALMNF